MDLFLYIFTHKNLFAPLGHMKLDTGNHVTLTLRSFHVEVKGACCFLFFLKLYSLAVFYKYLANTAVIRVNKVPQLRAGTFDRWGGAMIVFVIKLFFDSQLKHKIFSDLIKSKQFFLSGRTLKNFFCISLF